MAVGKLILVFYLKRQRVKNNQRNTEDEQSEDRHFGGLCDISDQQLRGSSPTLGFLVGNLVYEFWGE